MKALINNNYLLEKYSGKGGWTFVVIPELTKDVRDRLKLVKVKGTIDGFVIQKYHLSPITGGGVFYR